MALRYEEIDLGQVSSADDYRLVESGGKSTNLSRLDHVNIFVGPNNVGKSRLLRALFNCDQLTYRPNGPWRRIHEIDNMVRSEAAALPPLVQNPVELAPATELAGTIDWLREGQETIAKLLARVLKYQKWYSDLLQRTRLQPQLADHLQRINTLGSNIHQLIDQEALAAEFQRRLYFPVLRGLRPVAAPVKQDRTDVYRQRTEQDYVLTSKRGKIVTGLGLYDELFALLLGKRANRERVARYEDFLSAEFFGGRAVELTPQHEGDVVHVDIEGEGERPIFALGDGIQTLITLTYDVFFEEKGALLFIEEPETHLHPGLQRRFLELVTRHEAFAPHQIFLTTHSNHLLDMAGEYPGCSTFVVRRDKEHTTLHALTSPNRSVLEDLGARASSVFLTNATIWVEGVSDRLYLREYLSRFLTERKADRLLKEDVHYSFMEGGGSNIAHFNFLDSGFDELCGQIKVANMCSHSLVVLDGDNAGKPRMAGLEKALGGNLVLLKSKEIENLLPVEVLRAYVTHEAGSTTPASKLQLKHYHQKKTALGKKLDKVLQTTVFTEGQTVRKKAAVCTFCVEYMRTNTENWSLTPEAREVCERIAKFVAEVNQLTLPDA